MWGHPSSALELTDARNMLPPSHGTFPPPEEPGHRPKAKALSAEEDGRGHGHTALPGCRGGALPLPTARQSHSPAEPKALLHEEIHCATQDPDLLMGFNF